MRVISMVPSWTETLLAAGVNVVGRTRFCVHPELSVAHIPIVGGTKNWDLDLVRKLKPDLILLDKEENPKFMAEEAPSKWHASEVHDVASMPGELRALADALQSSMLHSMADRWERVSQCEPKQGDWHVLPGLVEWIKPPKAPHKPLHFVYLVWKDPWIAVSRKTFIGGMWRSLGFGEQMLDFPNKYQEVRLENFDPKTTALLFSTEPFPFVQKREELKKLPHVTAIVDGEAFSWFGLRSLSFLERELLIQT